MSRRVHDLSPAALQDLPEPCRACVFWETAGARRGPAGDAAAGRAAKEAWWQATQLEWGTPGKGVYVDGRLVGYVSFGPAQHFTGARRVGPAVSDDALLLATLWVAEEQRRGGLAAILLQAVMREAVRRGTRALEAYGERPSLPARQAPVEAPARCVLGEQFLLANGFAVHQEHPVHPLLRLDLRQTVRWQTSVGHAVEGVLEALTRRERRAPAPARTS